MISALRALGLAALTAWVLVGAAAAAAKSVQIPVRIAPRAPDVAVMRRITVAHFNGAGGEEFGQLLETELARVRYEEAPYFTLISGQGLAGSGPELAMQARQLGAEGVVFGDASAEVNDQPYQGSTVGCTARYYDGRCGRWGVVNISCVRRTARVMISTEVMRATDSRILYASTRNGMSAIQWCGSGRPEKSNAQMLLEARLGIVKEVLQDIAPTTGTMKATVKGDPKGLTPELAKKFRTALDTAGTSLESSCRLWADIDTAQPGHMWTSFNLGVCAEAAGDFGRALTLYQQVLGQRSSGDKDISAAITRATSLRQSQEKLAAAQQELERQAAAEAARLEAERKAALAAEAATRKRDAASAASQRQADAARRREAAARAAAAKAAQEQRRTELVAQHGTAAADAIISRRVAKGMTAAQVRAAKGPPGRIERLGGGVEQWHYGGQRIILTGGRVTYVGS